MEPSVECTRYLLTGAPLGVDAFHATITAWSPASPMMPVGVLGGPKGVIVLLYPPLETCDPEKA